MPSTDHPIDNNDILITFDPLTNEDNAIAFESTITEDKDVLPVDHVNAVLEDGSFTQLAMTNLQSLPASQRYCHVEDTYYILPNYVLPENVEMTNVSIPVPVIEKTSLISRLKTKFRSSPPIDKPQLSFGIPLDSLSPFPPPFFSTAFTSILQNPLEGVYRLSASVSAVSKAISLLNVNPLDDTFLRVVDKDQGPILAAALVKAFIRHIPGGLFNNRSLLADAINEFNEHKDENKLLTILHSLPHRNAIIVRQLFDHLNTLLAFSESTKMTAINLATCLGPNLFCDHSISQDGNKNEMDEAMAIAQLGTSLAKWLISDAHRVFNQLPTSHYIAAVLRDKSKVEWINYGSKTIEKLEDIHIIQQFPLFTKPFNKQSNTSGCYMNDLIEIDPFADSDQPKTLNNDNNLECSEMDYEQNIATGHDNYESENDPEDEDSCNLTNDSNPEGDMNSIEEQQMVHDDEETDPDPWEGDSAPIMAHSRSISLDEIQNPSNQETQEENETMSEPAFADSQSSSTE